MTDESSILVQVPRVLRRECEGLAEFQLSPSSVQGALQEIEQRFPTLYRSICDETGNVRRHVNVFVNWSHIRDRQGLDTPLHPGDTLSVLPAVSGG